MLFELLLATVGVLAGGIAAVSGFGIGSLLTPVLALQAGTKLAVAGVAIPHAIGTAQRFWLLRRHVDWRVVRSFGITSALGGLAGAFLQTRATSRALEVVFGVLLILAAITELTGWMRRVHWSRSAAWVAGALRTRSAACLPSFYSVSASICYWGVDSSFSVDRAPRTGIVQ